jgi:PHD/YefM family antitoxin component YafN of YafNO toxin-antitoxin module
MAFGPRPQRFRRPAAHSAGASHGLGLLLRKSRIIRTADCVGPRVHSLEFSIVREALITVSAKEVASKFGYYTDEAMLHPVGIQRHGTTRVVMLSLKEYERLLRRDRQVLLVKDLDDETLDAILNAEIPERSKELGRLLEDPEAD